jgi:hypothetical protein
MESVKSYTFITYERKGIFKERMGSLAHQDKGYPDDQKRRFTTEALSGILEELGENSSVKSGDESHFRRPTHNLAEELASRLNSTPRRDVWAWNGGCRCGLPSVSELLDESLIRDDAAVEVDFYSCTTSARANSGSENRQVRNALR